MISFQLRSIAKFSLTSKATPLRLERQALQIHTVGCTSSLEPSSPALAHAFLHISRKVQALRAALANEVAVILNAKIKDAGS